MTVICTLNPKDPQIDRLSERSERVDLTQPETTVEVYTIIDPMACHAKNRTESTEKPFIGQELRWIQYPLSYTLSNKLHTTYKTPTCGGSVTFRDHSRPAQAHNDHRGSTPGRNSLVDKVRASSIRAPKRNPRRILSLPIIPW